MVHTCPCIELAVSRQPLPYKAVLFHVEKFSWCYDYRILQA